MEGKDKSLDIEACDLLRVERVDDLSSGDFFNTTPFRKPI